MTYEEAMKKVRKLLALSASTNENEAQMALLRAHKLMAKFGIESVEAKETEHEHIDEECKGSGLRKKWSVMLADIISTNFRCKTFYVEKKTHFFGRTEDVEMAKAAYEYMYDFINKESGIRYRNALKWNGSGNGVVNSYAFGFIDGLRKALEEQSVALMVVTPQDVNNAYNNLISGKDFRTVKQRKSYYHRDSHYEAGYHDGMHSQHKRID